MTRIRIPALAGVLLLAAGPALAHPGHGAQSGFAVGLFHPFSGLDHLLAMVAVGLWAGLTFRKSWWIWPATFVGFMLAGFVLGVGHAAAPAAEVAIAASVIGLGLAIGLEFKPPAAVGSALIALFALAHGYAHGQEMPAGADTVRFALGFGLATVVLHGAGLAVAWTILRGRARPFVRLGGLGVAAAGVAMLLAT